MINKTEFTVVGSLYLLVPGVVFATETTNVGELFQVIHSYFLGIAPFLIGVAVLYFLWGVLQYVASGDSEEERIEGRHMMLNGVITIFVMVSIWGFVNFLSATFNLSLDPQEAPELDVIVW